MRDKIVIGIWLLQLVCAMGYGHELSFLDQIKIFPLRRNKTFSTETDRFKVQKWINRKYNCYPNISCLFNIKWAHWLFNVLEIVFKTLCVLKLKDFSTRRGKIYWAKDQGKNLKMEMRATKLTWFQVCSLLAVKGFKSAKSYWKIRALHVAAATKVKALCLVQCNTPASDRYEFARISKYIYHINLWLIFLFMNVIC